MSRSFLLSGVFFLLCAPVLAQGNRADSLNLDSLKRYPAKSSLPVKETVLQVLPVVIPVTELDLKVNYWRQWVTFGINLNQTSFSNNWSGGGINSLALGSLFNYKVDYTKDERNFVSEVILQYGKLKNKGQIERKTNDRIFWDNKLGTKLSKSWFFFGSVNFESQFDLGFSYGKDKAGDETRTLISRFLSPGYLTESVGFEYKPNKRFYLRIGTGTARQTFVLDSTIYRRFPKNYGVDHGNRFRNELAFQVVSSIDKDLTPNLNLKSRYTLFANYEKINNIDQRLDVTFTSKVTRLIAVTLAGTAIYDDDSSNRIQASQSLALGLVYKFPVPGI